RGPTFRRILPKSPKLLPQPGKRKRSQRTVRKTKNTYGRDKVGAVLLSILLRPPISLECGTYATRPDRLIQPKILGRKRVSAFGVSNRTCNWRQTTPKERKNGTSGAWWT